MASAMAPPSQSIVAARRSAATVAVSGVAPPRPAAAALSKTPTARIAETRSQAPRESTAREAWQHGYDLVVAEDATASVSAELHDMSVRFILPRLGRVRASAEIALGRG